MRSKWVNNVVDEEELERAGKSLLEMKEIEGKTEFKFVLKKRNMTIMCKNEEKFNKYKKHINC